MKIHHQTTTPGRYLSVSRAGMTFVEVLIAMTITGMVVMGIVKGYYFCTTSSEKGALALAANARAMERLEETRSAQWDTAFYPAIDKLVAANFPQKVVTLDLTGTGAGVTMATIVTQISQISTTPPIKRIHVDCIWTFNGHTLTNSVETCRSPDQ